MEEAGKYKANIRIAEGMEELSRRCLSQFLAEAKKAIEEKDVFTVAISGGKTPRRFYELLAESPESEEINWEKIHLFWVDERYVSKDSAASNYRLAYDTFISKVGIPDDNVHSISTEPRDYNEAARGYEQTMVRVFQLKKGDVPEFDLIILGMGADGHTGSMFPGSCAGIDSEELVCAVEVQGGEYNRISLTGKVLLAARLVIVLVAGKEKAEVLLKVVGAEKEDAMTYPIHILWSILDRVIWLVDREAASLLVR